MVLNIDQTSKDPFQTAGNCYASTQDLSISEEVYVGIAGHHKKVYKPDGDIVRQQNDDEIRQDEMIN
jgi:hypothetical protein